MSGPLPCPVCTVVPDCDFGDCDLGCRRRQPKTKTRGSRPRSVVLALTADDGKAVPSFAPISFVVFSKQQRKIITNRKAQIETRFTVSA